MSLKETIQRQMTAAMKQKDAIRLGTLRMLRAAIKNREVELQQGLDDHQVVRVVRSQIKQRKEAISQYEEGGRDDLAQKEQQELAVLMSFMPRELSPEEIEGVVTNTIQELHAKDMKDMGRVMKTVMGKVADSADGKVVNDIVRKHLTASSEVHLLNG
jgi:uncharacterized protein YqeY